MKTFLVITLQVLVFVLAPGSDVWPQHLSSPASALSELKSPNMQRRIDAYGKLSKDKAILKKPEVIAALLDLLDRENQLIHKTLVDSDGKIGVSDKYGEGYGEYVAELLGTVVETVDWHDPRQLCILAQSSYGPESPFADKLAREGGALVAPCLLKMAHGIMYGRQDSAAVRAYDRNEAIPVLVEIAAVTQDLSPALREQIRQLTIVGLEDRNERLIVVFAVGKFGTSEFVAILQEIAKSDPYSRLFNGQRRFDIREAAAKAIQSIEERSKTH